MQVEMRPVQSSRIAAIGFDEEAFELYIKFPPTKTSPSGKTYVYEYFAPEQWDDIQRAESIGIYFGENILNNANHPFRCLDEVAVQAEAPRAEVLPPAEPTELPEDEDGLKIRALEVKDKAQALVISSPEHYAAAAAELKLIVGEKRIAQERVDRIKKPAYATYQAALQLEKDVIGPYTQAEQFFKSGMAKYSAEEERKRREQERAIAAQRQKEADEAAAERAKELADQDAKVLEAQGEPEMAAQVRANPLPVAAIRVAPVVLQKETPKVEGISTRQNWTFRIVDPALIPREYMSIDESKIRAVVKALKSAANIAGVEVYAENAVAVRA